MTDDKNKYLIKSLETLIEDLKYIIRKEDIIFNTYSANRADTVFSLEDVKLKLKLIKELEGV